MSNLKSGQAERKAAVGADADGTEFLRVAIAAHFCFGAPSARAEGQIALEVMLRRLKNIRLGPPSLAWRNNFGQRGLMSLRVAFGEEGGSGGADSGRTQI